MMTYLSKIYFHNSFWKYLRKIRTKQVSENIVCSTYYKTCRQYCSGQEKLEDLDPQDFNGPLDLLRAKVERKELHRDEHQEKIVYKLQRVYDDVENYSPPERSLFSKLFDRKYSHTGPKGLYLYGAVGGGKTMLMDLFYSCCKVNKILKIFINIYMVITRKCLLVLRFVYYSHMSVTFHALFGIKQPLVEMYSINKIKK